MNIRSKQTQKEGIGFLKHMNIRLQWTKWEGFSSSWMQDHDEHKKKASKTYEHKIKTSKRGRHWVFKTHEHEIKMKEEESVCL